LSACFFFVSLTEQQETTKLTTKNSTEKHKWKRAECDHVRKKGKKTSEADSFRHMEIQIKKYTTHLKMAMKAETCSVRQ
jgi:hypothetical protein